MSETVPRPGQILQGTYRIERLIGEGGMGAVYEASHLRLSRRFAVKMLNAAVAEDEQALARFRREAEITSALGHPHILEVIDFNHAPDGVPYIVMELLDGEDLARRTKRLKRFELCDAASVFEQTASALQAVHDKGIVHRDLKPQNIFLCNWEGRDDFVKVVDFGVSKILGSDSPLTSKHALLGTPFYMAPEQAERRSAEVDSRTDMYAMATIVYEMLVGHPPFTGDSIPVVLYRIVRDEPSPIHTARPDVPEAVDTVVMKALNKRQSDRFASMAEFWREFARAARCDSSAPKRKGRPGAVGSTELVGQKVGNYVVTELLGKGGMGSVYLAEHPQIRRQVAIKVIGSHLVQDQVAANRFVNEAMAISQIDHPNIIDVYDFGHLEDGRLYYVMEKLKGRELSAVMAERGKMAATEVAPYVEQICSALQAAHDRGVVHRDLKPENIFVLDEAPLRLKILDFGIAKLLETPQGASVTSTGMVMGTPLVIAPEQAAGKPEQIGNWTDLYSLGVILYWMLAGRPPFVDDTPALLLGRHIVDRPPPLLETAPAVPPAVASVVMQCLEKDPAKRPGSAAELARGYGDALRVPRTQDLDVEPEPPAGRPTVSSRPPQPIVDIVEPKQHTTMRGSAGEITAGVADQLVRRSLRQKVGLAGAGVAILVIAIAVLVFSSRGQVDPVDSGGSLTHAGASPDTRTPVAVHLPDGAATREPSKAEPAAPPVLHTITVNANIPRATCRLRAGRGKPQTQTVPCTYQARAGQKTHLEVLRPGYEPFSEDWKVDGDRRFEVKLRTKRHVAPRPKTSDRGTAKSTTPSAPGRSAKREKKKSGLSKSYGEGTIPLPDAP